MKYNEITGKSQGGVMLKVYQFKNIILVLSFKDGRMKYYCVKDVITFDKVKTFLSENELIDLKCHEEHLIMDANDGRTSSEARK